jgi:hypothetical protein
MPKEDVIRDLIKAMNDNAYVSKLVLTALYRREQMKEADKVPPIWRPLTVLVPGLVTGQNPVAINVFPRNPKRSGFSLLNNSGGSIYFAGKTFDINQTTTTLSGTSQGVIEAGVLAVGQQISIVSSGPLFVGAASATASVLTVIETMFLETTKDTSDDGRVHQGYGDEATVISSKEHGEPGSWHVIKELV